RICDMPPDLPSVLGLTALIQCLVHQLSGEIDRGIDESECHPLLVRQNRWRAARYGLGASLVDPHTLETAPARRLAERLVRRLRGAAAVLGCAEALESAAALAAGPTGAERQMALYRQAGDLAEVIRILVARSSLAPAGLPRGFRDRPAAPMIAGGI